MVGRSSSSPESRVVGTSNAVIDIGVFNAVLAAFPTRATVPLLAYNTAAVVLAATNSFVWNRRFTFRVCGPLQAGEVARFVVVAASTAGLNDLVLLALSGLFPALMGSFAASSERPQAGSYPGRAGALIFRHAFLGVSRQVAVIWPPCTSEGLALIVGQGFKRLPCSRSSVRCCSQAAYGGVSMNTHQPWSPYAGSSSIILAVVLLLVTGVLLSFATRFHHPVSVKRPGTGLRVAIVVIWVLSVMAVLVTSSIYVLTLYRQEGGHLTAAADHITPVTMTSALVAFLVIAYLARGSGFWVAVGSAIVGTIAAPMIFELPFDLIVMWRISAPVPVMLNVLFFFSLILVEILSLAMLTFSPVMKLSRYTLFLLAGMFVIFAVWAVFGFAYPATPLPIALNMISKVLAFAAAVSLFLPPEKSAWFVRKEVPARQVIGR